MKKTAGKKSKGVTPTPKRKKEQSKHKTVRVQWEGMAADIDEEIAPLIRELWTAGLMTMMSCQEDPEGRVWIQFPLVIFAEMFMDLIEKESDTAGVWQHWRFEIYPVTTSPVLFFDYPEELRPKGPGLRFAVSVRFPKENLPAILETLVKHNKRATN